jgi:hypothetical protein
MCYGLSSNSYFICVFIAIIRYYNVTTIVIVLENGKVILARRIEIIHYFCHSCVKKENSNPPKILSFFHTFLMHLYKNVNPLQKWNWRRRAIAIWDEGLS